MLKIIYSCFHVQLRALCFTYKVAAKLESYEKIQKAATVG